MGLNISLLACWEFCPNKRRCKISSYHVLLKALLSLESHSLAHIKALIDTDCFCYDEWFRNELLEREAAKQGVSFPAARKTGTTICGVVFKVRGWKFKKIYLTGIYSYGHFTSSRLHVGAIFYFLTVLQLKQCYLSVNPVFVSCSRMVFVLELTPGPPRAWWWLTRTAPRSTTSLLTCSKSPAPQKNAERLRMAPGP